MPKNNAVDSLAEFFSSKEGADFITTLHDTLRDDPEVSGFILPFIAPGLTPNNLAQLNSTALAGQELRSKEKMLATQLAATKAENSVQRAFEAKQTSKNRKFEADQAVEKRTFEGTQRGLDRALTTSEGAASRTAAATESQADRDAAWSRFEAQQKLEGERFRAASGNDSRRLALEEARDAREKELHDINKEMLIKKRDEMGKLSPEDKMAALTSFGSILETGDLGVITEASKLIGIEPPSKNQVVSVHPNTIKLIDSLSRTVQAANYNGDQDTAKSALKSLQGIIDRLPKDDQGREDPVTASEKGSMGSGGNTFSYNPATGSFDVKKESK